MSDKKTQGELDLERLFDEMNYVGKSPAKIDAAMPQYLKDKAAYDAAKPGQDVAKYGHGAYMASGGADDLKRQIAKHLDDTFGKIQDVRNEMSIAPGAPHNPVPMDPDKYTSDDSWIDSMKKAYKRSNLGNTVKQGLSDAADSTMAGIRGVGDGATAGLVKYPAAALMMGYNHAFDDGKMKWGDTLDGIDQQSDDDMKNHPIATGIGRAAGVAASAAGAGALTGAKGAAALAATPALTDALRSRDSNSVNKAINDMGFDSYDDYLQAIRKAN